MTQGMNSELLIKALAKNVLTSNDKSPIFDQVWTRTLPYFEKGEITVSVNITKYIMQFARLSKTI